MELDLRRMHNSDIDKVYNFFNNLKSEGAMVSFSDINDKRQLLQWLNDKNVFVYLAALNDEIVGVFRGIRGEKYKKHSALLTAAVDVNLRGRKIAQKLTDYGLKDMKNKGIKIARAYVYSDNNSSVSALLKLGFSLSGSVHMHHFNEDKQIYVDDLIFHKIL